MSVFSGFAKWKNNTNPVNLVLDGGGYPAYAEKWLKSQAGDNNRLIQVLIKVNLRVLLQVENCDMYSSGLQD